MTESSAWVLSVNYQNEKGVVRGLVGPLLSINQSSKGFHIRRWARAHRIFHDGKSCRTSTPLSYLEDRNKQTRSGGAGEGVISEKVEVNLSASGRDPCFLLCTSGLRSRGRPSAIANHGDIQADWKEDERARRLPAPRLPSSGASMPSAKTSLPQKKGSGDTKKNVHRKPAAKRLGTQKKGRAVIARAEGR